MRVIIYELPVRLFTNANPRRVARGTLAQNGAGRFNEINDAALESIRGLGVTHIWLVGVLRQATLTSHPGLPADPADVVKGIAGSWFAIRDYYDVCPDYAESVPARMQEFEALVQRIHAHGMKVLIDLVPNHVARGYHSVVRPELDFGLNDDRTVFFSPLNNFFHLVDPTGQRLSITPPERWKLEGMTGTFELEDGEGDHVPRATGNNQTSAQLGAFDWYDTVKLNYGYNFVTTEKRFDPIPSTWWKMDEIIEYWQGKGVDGFRCDFAHWIPVEFWRFAIGRARARNRDAYLLAEAFDAWDAVPGYSKAAMIEAGFDAVYDDAAFRTVKRVAQGVGWANDLDLLLDASTFATHLVRYTENHDERRAASPVVQNVDPLQSGFGSARGGLAASQALWLAGRGPILLQAGQELGEAGADQEGYSGADGRTSIFDYWSLPKLMAWSNGGQWDAGGCSWAERQCRRCYARLLEVARRVEFAEGGVYGLNHANRHEQGFGGHGRWLWSHLRWLPNSASLSVVNLSSSESFESRVKIPREAQRLAGWPDLGTALFEPLCECGKRVSLSLSDLAEDGLPVAVPASTGEVFSITVRGGSS
ncbi:MAG: alpha-amylase [Deltaproteobacteria bacterium]|nr:alpha-amylase [Deltaproteobacteria bacterium]